MIIVGQSKKYITNIEKANGISITEFSKYDRTTYGAEIVIRFDKENVTLGKYKTAERANEILQEIIRYYAIANIGQVFEMPKE